MWHYLPCECLGILGLNIEKNINIFVKQSIFADVGSYCVAFVCRDMGSLCVIYAARIDVDVMLLLVSQRRVHITRARARQAYNSTYRILAAAPSMCTVTSLASTSTSTSTSTSNVDAPLYSICYSDL
jgi:hypothetical protein